MNTNTQPAHSEAEPLVLRIGKTYRTRGDYHIRTTGVDYTSGTITARVLSVPSDDDLYEPGEEIDLRPDGQYDRNRFHRLDVIECLDPEVITTCKMLIEVPLANIDAVINSGVAVLEMRQ